MLSEGEVGIADDDVVKDLDAYGLSGFAHPCGHDAVLGARPSPKGGCGRGSRRRHNHERQVGHAGGEGPEGPPGRIRPLPLHHRREPRWQGRGEGVDGVSRRGDGVAWWRTSVATSCGRRWTGETLSSSSKCWPRGTTGTPTCPER